MMPKVFLTVFMSRSGSKFLRELLNKNKGQVFCAGECFHDKPKNFPDDGAIFAKLAGLLVRPEEHVGIQYRFPRHFIEFPMLKAWFEEHNTRISVLFLARRNHLKAAVSQQNAERLKRTIGKAHLHQSDTESIDKISLDIGRVVKETRDRELKDDEYRLWAKQHFNILEVFYEDLCQEPLTELGRISTFLGFPFSPTTFDITTNLKKVTSDDLSEAVENFEELRAALVDAGLEKYV